MEEKTVVLPTEKPTYEQLEEQIKQLKTQLHGVKRRPLTLLDSESAVEKVVKTIIRTLHGKSYNFSVKFAYMMKQNQEDFFSENSFEQKVCSFIENENEKYEIYTTLTQKLRKNQNGYYDLPPITDLKSAVINLILLAHCLGIQASKNGLVKPRNVTTPMFYWHIINLEKQDEDIESIDSFFLRLCYGHIKNDGQIIERVRLLLRRIWNVRTRLAQGNE